LLLRRHLLFVPIAALLVASGSTRAQTAPTRAPTQAGTDIAFLASTSVAVASGVVALGCGIGTGLLENAANNAIFEWNEGATIDPEEMRAIEANEAGFGVCTAIAAVAIIGGVVGAIVSLPATTSSTTASVEGNAE